MGVAPDGVNINKNAGSTKPEGLAEVVCEKGADLGIAFDGDGDRVIMVDGNGDIVDGDELLFIIALDRQQHGELQGGVVGTLMTNLGMEKALEEKGIAFARANVGDRYVNEMMIDNGWEIGGESSGHIICRDVSTTGDGIVSALQILKAVIRSGKPLAGLRAGMTRFPQIMVNVKVKVKSDTSQIPVIVEAVAESEKEMAGRGRVLLRPSGTEPVIRVMVEGEDASEVRHHVDRLAEVVRTAMV